MVDLKADSRREELVFGTQIDWENDVVGGLEYIASYSDHREGGIGTELFGILMDEGYVDPEDTQNYSPTMKHLLEFGEALEDEFDVTVEYTGYMISPDRSDARITMDAISVHPNEGELSIEARDRFRNAFAEGADEYDEGENEMRAWWD